MTKDVMTKHGHGMAPPAVAQADHGYKDMASTIIRYFYSLKLVAKTPTY
jgi:hypothetical protein